MLPAVTTLLLGTLPSTLPPQEPPTAIVEPTFSEWDVPLQDLDRMAQKYEEREEARSLLHAARDAIESDPIFSNKSVTLYYTYEENRSGKNLSGPQLCVNDVCVDNQRFILAGLPENTETAAQYWNVILQQGTRVIVSLHDNTEAQEAHANFWKQDALDQMRLLDGWTITEKEQEILIAGEPKEVVISTSQSPETVSPGLIKTRLLATNGKETKTLFHLHYVGWPDHSAISDETVFQALLDQMHILSPKKSAPIAINCHAGIGRTGAAAVTYILERQIEEAVREGKEDLYRVNIPRIVFVFRQQRPYALPNSGNVPKIFSVLEKYYKRLTKEKAKQ